MLHKERVPSFLYAAWQNLTNICQWASISVCFFFPRRNPQQCTIYATSKNLFSASVQVEWTRDLPNLRFLHLTKMPKLQSLDTDFRSMPHLRELNCRDSHSLGFVRTEMFESTPNLSHLSFQKWVVFFSVVLHQSLPLTPRTTVCGADFYAKVVCHCICGKEVWVCVSWRNTMHPGMPHEACAVAAGRTQQENR